MTKRSLRPPHKPRRRLRRLEERNRLQNLDLQRFEESMKKAVDRSGIVRAGSKSSRNPRGG